MLKCVLFLCCITVLLPKPLHAQSAEQDQDAVENSLSTGHQITGSAPQRMNVLDRMAFHHIPGASVALIHNGKVEWVGAYGVRQTGGPPSTTSTLFCVASISKAVTALGVLRLAQEGKIDLDHDVNSYLKRWKVPTNQWTSQRAVTTRMILRHTAGFGESIGHIYKPSDVPTLLQELNGKAPATNPPVQVKMLPGSRFEYSNDGYLVLQLLVEDLTGKPFGEAMRSLVLDPLGMTHSTYEMPLSDRYAQNAASAFGGRQKIGTPPEQFAGANLAAGGLWSNAADLARVAIEIQSAYAGKHSKVLNQKTARMMLTPGEGFPPDAQGAMFGGHEHWGLGIEMAGNPEHPFFDHGGSAVYESFMFMYLNGDGITVTTNSTNGFSLIYELLQSAAHVYGWPDFTVEEHPAYQMSATEMDKFAGDYRGGIHIQRTADGLVFKSNQEQEPAPMVAWSPTRFIMPGHSEELNFRLDSSTHQVLSLTIDTMQAQFNVNKVALSHANK